MDELAAGIRRWTAPHPEWRPAVEEVESYALIVGPALLLVDPLVPAEDDERRMPVLMKSKVAIGSISVVLQEYKAGA